MAEIAIIAPAMYDDHDHKESLKEQLDYAMKHFLFVADQRIKSVHYYILVAGGSTAATFQLLDKFSTSVAGAVGVAHLLTAIVFTMIEKRNNSLLETAREALSHVEEEQEHWNYWSKVATRDAERKPRFFTYTNAIIVAIAAQIVVGTALLLAVFFPRAGEAKTAFNTMTERTNTPERVSTNSVEFMAAGYNSLTNASIKRPAIAWRGSP